MRARFRGRKTRRRCSVPEEESPDCDACAEEVEGIDREEVPEAHEILRGAAPLSALSSWPPAALRFAAEAAAAAAAAEEAVEAAKKEAEARRAARDAEAARTAAAAAVPEGGGEAVVHAAASRMQAEAAAGVDSRRARSSELEGVESGRTAELESFERQEDLQLTFDRIMRDKAEAEKRLGKGRSRVWRRKA